MTIPTARGALRACVEPLLGYAAAVATALVLMVFLVVGLAISDDSSDDPTSEIDIEAIGTLIGMPFQVAAMGLGGSLSFGDTDFDIALFSPALLVTGAFLAVVFLLSRRREAAVPSASTTERLLLAASGALGTALVALVLTRALAMRDDGDVMHAAGFGLFFGVLLGGGAAAFLGRQSANGSLWPRWLPADGRRALHLTTQHLLVGTLILLPITVLWWLVDSGVEAALFALVWGPTVALAAFGLGHLGGVTAFGDTQMAWDFGWFPGIVLPLVAVGLALVASLAWHLRRGPDRALLAHPASWVTLPASYAGAALVLCLLTTVGLHGELWGFDGGLWLHVTYWLIPVLAAWGAVIELSSRFVAPALVRAVPAAIARRLAKGPARLLSPPTGPVQRVPMSPADQARAKKALIGVGVVGGLALVGGIVVSVLGSKAFGPESRAEAYLDALVDGDAEAALDLAPVDDDEAGTELLTNAVYGESEERITGYEIVDVDVDGDSAVITVDLEGVEDGDDVELRLESDGRRAVFFSDWKVADGGLAQELTVSIPESSEELLVNGASVEVSTGDDVELWAYPGSYAIDPYGASEWLEASDSVTTVSGSGYGTWADLEDPAPSQALRDFVDGEVETWLSDCMRATVVDPDGCPQSGFAYGDKQRKVVWTLTQAPTVAWDYFSGSFPFDLSTGSAGEASLTYEYDASYGYGPADWTRESDTSSLYLSGTVDLVDGQPVVTFSAD